MAIYDFINSKDVRNYLQEIHYQFATPEAAFIVYWCKKATLDEKIEAWQEIIKTMPGCSMEKRLQMMQIDSFHGFLRDYIALQKRDIQDFLAGDGYVYSWYDEISEMDNGGYGDFFFSDYASCLDDCRKNDLGVGITICKYMLNQPEDMRRSYPDTIRLNSKMEIMEVNVFHEKEYDKDLKKAFEGMGFDFPTPFKRGDILHYPLNTDRPFVLHYITTWDSKEMFSRGFSEHECPFRDGWEAHDRFVRETLENRGVWDIHAVGMVIDDEEGTLLYDNTLRSPIDLEYYQEPLKGMERQLQVVSLYEKREADAEVLANCCSAIRIEESAKKLSYLYTHLYRRGFKVQLGMLFSDEITRGIDSKLQ